MNENEKNSFGDNATRQVNTANFLILYIFKQSLTYVHKRIYEHINYSLVISWASCVSPQPLLFTCNEPLFLITRAGALRKVDAMVVFTSLSEHLCDFMTAAEKKNNQLLSKPLLLLTYMWFCGHWIIWLKKYKTRY